MCRVDKKIPFVHKCRFCNKVTGLDGKPADGPTYVINENIATYLLGRNLCETVPVTCVECLGYGTKNE